VALHKSQCLTCKSNYYLTVDNICVTNCPDKFYNLFGKCEQCSPPCYTCVDEEYCLSCMDGFGYVYEGNFYVIMKVHVSANVLMGILRLKRCV
jgi:hypothetical protein